MSESRATTNPFSHFESSDSESDASSSNSSEVGGMAAFVNQLTQEDFDQLDQIVSQLDTREFLQALNPEEADFALEMLDLLGRRNQQDNKKPKLERAKFAAAATYKSTRPKRTPPIMYDRLHDGPKMFIVEDHCAYIGDGFSRQFVGLASCGDCFHIMPQFDPYQAASEINESTNSKGTAMGFSSFLHLIAICCVASGEGVLEPLEGNDLNKWSLSFEITGMNYMERHSRTRSTITLNKYLVAPLFCHHDDDFEFIFKASFAEDSADPTYLLQTSFYQGDTPYSDKTKTMIGRIMEMSESNFLNLANMFKSWFSRQTVKELPSAPEKLNSVALDEALSRGGKLKNGKLTYPSPLRVLPGKELDDEVFKSQDNVYQPDTISHLGGETTFHTYSVDSDWQSDLLRDPKVVLPSPFLPDEHYQNFIHGRLSRHAAYTSLIIESELSAKINGRSGSFYSHHSRAGVAWKMTSTNSLTWYVSYFVSGKPHESCGKWRLIDDRFDMWMSPTFKMSVEDIHFAKLLFHRIITMVAAVIPYTSDQERPLMVASIIKMSAVMKWSSWQTSAYAKDLRHLVLNLISRTGDPQTQLDNVRKLVNKPLSFPDYALITLMKAAVVRYNSNIERTPLLGMPMRFINFEKDTALLTMWHMRPLKDPFVTVKKLVEAVVVEQTDRSSQLDYADRVNIALDLVNRGLFTQDNFDELMDNRPFNPHFNPLLFIALSHIAVKDTNFGERQKPTGVRMSTLLSDKRNITLTKKNEHTMDGAIIRNARVADSMFKFIEQYGNPPNIYALVARASRNEKITYCNWLVEKGAKSSPREIPQMTPGTRLMQMLEEKNLEIYVDQEEVDNMTDPAKFAKFAEDSAKVMREGGSSSSEDKKSFCHWFLPEYMGVAVYCIARMAGSTGMITSAAVLLTDTSRWTVLPAGIEDSKLSDVISKEKVTIVSGKKITPVWAIKNLRNFQQGQKAMAAACINTVFTKAVDQVQRETTPDITFTTARTTSDDASRGVIVKPDSAYDEKSIVDDYFSMPLGLAKSCMMLNSDDKFVTSSKIVEFNNVTAGPNGLFTSCLTFAALAVQPLLGDNPMDDIIAAVSNARMSLQWGASIDLVRSAFQCNLVMLRQKWLFDEEEMDQINSCGLIPNDDEGLIAGFSVRENDMKLRLLSLLDEEGIESVLQGDLNIVNVLRSFRVRNSKKKKIKKVLYQGQTDALVKQARRLNASRSIHGRMQAAVIRPLPVKKRLAVKEGFLELIVKPLPLPTPRVRAAAALIPTQHPIRILPQYPKVRHMMPLQQGESRNPEPEVDLNIVRVKRLSGMNLSRPLRPSEEAIALLPQDDFRKFEFKQEMDELRSGVSYKSPGGAPLMRVLNGIVLKVPMAFTFKVDLPVEPARVRPVHIQGEDYTNFEPLWLSGSLITKMRQMKASIPYGTAWKGDDHFAFHLTSSNRHYTILLPKEETRLHIVQTPQLRYKLLVPTQPSYTPILCSQIGEVVRPWFNNFITGDLDAQLNYGNYINTRTLRNKSLRDSIFKSVGAKEPDWAHSKLPEYPYHPDRSHEVVGARVNRLIGSKRVCALKITFKEIKPNGQNIFLDGPKIDVTRMAEEEVEEDPDFDLL